MNTFKTCDASVLLTALFGTNNRLALRLENLLNDKRSRVTILPYTAIEFANGLRFTTRDAGFAKQILEKFSKLFLSVMQITPVDIIAITELSYRFDTTVYDTAYHYMAIMQEGVFITCDRSYYKKAAQLDHIELWE